MGELAAIVLAAGKSTRMMSDLPKVLHEVCGRSMLSFALSACRLAGVDRILVVVGHRKDDVIAEFGDAKDITWVEQTEQKGTGHAVQCGREALSGFSGSVLVLAGDMPLVRRPTLAGLYEAREQSGDACAMATTVLDDPTGYGRIIRDESGRLESIVEHEDCTAPQREIREVNPSYYCFDAESLWWSMEQVKPQGSQEEYYITDAVRILGEAGRGVSAPLQIPAQDAMGVNSRMDLATVGRVMQDRLQRQLLDEGVTIIDPDNTWIEAEATIGRETIVYPFTFVGRGARVGEGCRIGPFGVVATGESVTSGAVVGANTALGK